jgi:hypothetical protein
MGFLSKKSMLVSLLALSLAACAGVSKPPPPKKETTINLPCDYSKVETTIEKKPQTIIFQTPTGSACEVTDVNFKTYREAFKNKRHIGATSGGAATSGDPVAFDYDGSPIPNGAEYGYDVKSGSGTLGSGGGIIK